MSATAAERVANTLTLPMVEALRAADADGLRREDVVDRHVSYIRRGKPCTRTATALERRGLIKTGIRPSGQRYSVWQLTGLGEQVLACLPERRTP